MDIGGLNQAQRQAVEHTIGPALVVAGAGTGKTRVITARIAYLIEAGTAQPHQILALTFTEKAAREMAERLYDLIGWQSYAVPVLTFNAFGAELLGRYASHVGRSTGGGLVNDTQKALLLQQYLNRVKLAYYGPHTNVFEFLEGVVQYIGRLKNAGINVEQYAEYVASLQKYPGEMHPHDVTEQQDLSKLFYLYEAIKIETGTYDYHDQLEVPLQILQQRPNLAERLTSQYKFVLVDEYQDTNNLQDELLRAFVPPDGNLFVVGDDDQAIYGFRGAQIGNILGFVDHFKVAKPIALTQNYRSGQEILDAAYRLIQSNNPDRLESRLGLDKRLVAQTTGSYIGFQPYQTAADELAGTAEAVQARIKAGEAPDSIAVLSATHAPLKQLAKQLRAHGVPFALSTKVNIFEQPELNQLWYLLEWVGMKADEESLAHVMLSRFMGWSAEQYRHLVEQRRQELDGAEDVLRSAAANGDTMSADAVTKLDTWRQWAGEIPVSQLAFRLVFESGVSDQLRQAAIDQPRIIRVFEDLGRLLDHMQDYETVAKDTALVGYLKNFPKPPEIEVSEPLGDTAGVQLLTVHASKGLEFNSVYLIGCTQRVWTHGRSRGWEVPEALVPALTFPPEHELRRLLYVAVTRAKQHLVISAATHTSGGARQTVSPMIIELLGDKVLSPKLQHQSENDASGAIKKLQRYYPLQSVDNSKRLPFETSDGWLELAVGDLANYDFCPYDFYLDKVLGIRQPYGPQLAFGTAVHSAIQAYYVAQLLGETLDLPQLEARLNELWSDRGYANREQAESAKKQAILALHNFVAREARADRRIKGSELPIRLEIPDAKLRLRGRIDAWFETPEGIELRDFKTGRKTNLEAVTKAAKSSFQLRSYALAYRHMTGNDVSRVTLDYVVTGVEGSVQLSSAIIKNHYAKLMELADAIRQRQFAPNPSNVHQCAAIRYYGTAEDEAVHHA